MSNAHRWNIWQQLWYSYRYSTCSALSTIAHFVTNSVYSCWGITTHRYTTCRWIQYRCIWRSRCMSNSNSYISSCACSCRTSTYAVVSQYITYSTWYYAVSCYTRCYIIWSNCWCYITYYYSCCSAYTACWRCSRTNIVTNSIYSVRRCRWYRYYSC